MVLRCLTYPSNMIVEYDSPVVNGGSGSEPWVSIFFIGGSLEVKLPTIAEVGRVWKSQRGKLKK